jgi:hypothetical protein
MEVPMFRILVPSALMLSVIPAEAGVVLGHPVDLRIAAAEGISFTDLVLVVGEMEAEPCDAGEPVVFDVDATFDLDDPFTLPEGTWCGIRLEILEPVVIEGSGTEGGTFAMTLAMSHIPLNLGEDPLVVTTTTGGVAVELAAPGWTDPEMLELAPSQHRTFTAGTEPGATLKHRIVNGSSVVR